MPFSYNSPSSKQEIPEAASTSIFDYLVACKLVYISTKIHSAFTFLKQTFMSSYYYFVLIIPISYIITAVKVTNISPSQP